MKRKPQIVWILPVDYCCDCNSTKMLIRCTSERGPFMVCGNCGSENWQRTNVELREVRAAK